MTDMITNRLAPLPLCSFAVILLLISLMPTIASADQIDRDVLILHSYHPDLAWTAGINVAMQDHLLANNPDLSLHVEYLDTKRNPSTWYRESYIEGVLLKKLAGHHFGLILSSDNDAFNFILRHHDDLFKGTPIVFCGVNGFTPDMLIGTSGITGVAEKPAFAKTIDLSLHLHPETTELIFIGETSTETGRKNDHSLKELTANLNSAIRASFWNDQTLSELKPRLQALLPGQIVFLTSTISDGNNVLDFAESAQQTRYNSQVPVYGFWDFFLGNGIVGGRLINSEAQGTEAAKIGLRILNNDDPSAIPVTVSEANRYMFDNSELTRFNIPLDRLPANSLIINRPPSSYSLDKWQLWAGLIFILLMGLCISLLLHIIVIRRKSEKEISARERLASLGAEIGRALTRDTSLKETLQSCCEALLKKTETAFGRIWVIDENDPNLLELHASAGLFSEVEKSAHRFKKVGEQKVGVIASERKPMLTNQVQGDPLFTDQKWILKDGIVGFAGYPLVVDDRVVGVIGFFSKQPLTDHVQHAIASVADMIAVGIQRYRTGLALQKSVSAAEEGRDNLDAILKSVSDGLIVTDLDQKIVLINEAAEKLLDIDFTQVAGKLLCEAIKGRPYAESLQKLLQNSDTEIEFSLSGINGSDQRIIHARTSNFHRRKVGQSGAVAVLHDVTKLRELDRMKSEFIAVAAHELRTPLATIQGYAELMHSAGFSAKMTDEEQHEYLGYIIDRGDALERIIDDLLDVGRAETGRTLVLERTPCEMIALVHEIINHHRRESPTYTFITDCPEVCLKLTIDRNMMHRVFDNLLSNAVKYSPEGATIRIRGKMSGDSLVITVADEGLGMTPEQIDQAFNKFYRADASNTAVRGLGLGLTICEAIIEAHGGTIWIDSQVNRGSEIHFALPITSDNDSEV